MANKESGKLEENKRLTEEFLRFLERSKEAVERFLEEQKQVMDEFLKTLDEQQSDC